MNKNTNKEAKRQGKRLKAIREKNLKKKKEGILREVFYTVGVVFTQQVLYT